MNHSKRSMRRAHLKALGAAALIAVAAAPTAVLAQDAYPSRAIRLIVPFAAGGAIDIIARSVSAEMAKKLGQPMVVENRTGAGGNIGAEAVAKSAPDGYTLVTGTSATHGVNPGLFAKMPYDAIKDFAPVSYWGGVPNVLVVKADGSIKSVEQLAAEAKKEPGKFNYGSAGNGTSLHLAGELFQRAAGLQLTHIPYKGGAPASVDLLAGNITMMFDTVAVSLPNIRAGKTVPLAVSASERHFALPGVPTFAEKGWPSVISETWTGIFAPRGTPPAVLKTLENASAAALKEPAVMERLNTVGVQQRAMTREQFTAFVAAEVQKWGKVVKDAGIKIE
jgi:tripartite-type tricarboxylate transporter receptor subunit TctC